MLNRSRNPDSDPALEPLKKNERVRFPAQVTARSHPFDCDYGPIIDFCVPNDFVQETLKEKHAMANVASKFTPLHDRILVRRIDEGETIRGGIIIPDSAKEKPQEGEVIAVGKGKSNDEGKTFPLDVKAGDRVLFGKYSGTEIKIDGEEFLIMREEEVLGILK